MASIRRTLSPVPRPGALLNGEVVSVASPLSKSCSSAQNYPSQPTVSPSSSYSSLHYLASSYSSLHYLAYKTQSFVLGIFSKRHSRPKERPRSKGQTWWRRSLVHFFICFMVGILLGLTPSVSMNLSFNPMSKHHTFSFEEISPLGKAQIRDTMPKNVTTSLDSWEIERSMKWELTNASNDDDHVIQPLNEDSDVVYRKLLIIVTPTYARPIQAYYMIRLANTLKLVPPPLLWIVVDMAAHSADTADILRRTGVMYRHLVCDVNLTEVKDRGVRQRNLALSHIETHRLDGIVYFADDDNIYSVDLFEQMRQISGFGTWMVAKLMDRKGTTVDFEGPSCNGTRVIGWHTNEATKRFRRFHAERSGFAFNSTVLWDPKRWHRPTLEPIRQVDNIKEPFEVSTFIEQIVEDESQMEGLMQDCSRIMVWQFPIESSYVYPPEWYMNNNLDVIASLA